MLLNSGIQVCASTRIQVCASTRIQVCASTRIQVCASTRIQVCASTRIQVCASTRIQVCASTRIQVCASTRKETEAWGHAYRLLSEMQESTTLQNSTKTLLQLGGLSRYHISTVFQKNYFQEQFQGVFTFYRSVFSGVKLHSRSLQECQGVGKFSASHGLGFCSNGIDKRPFRNQCLMVYILQNTVDRSLDVIFSSRAILETIYLFICVHAVALKYFWQSPL